MTTLTNDQLFNVLGGNGPAQLTPAEAQAAKNAGKYFICKGDAILKNGAFPKAGSVRDMLAHTEREQQAEIDCAGKYPVKVPALPGA